MRYLDDIGLLGPRLNLVHAVWMRPDEVDLVADKGGRIVHSPVSNLKLKSGIAPILDFRRADIELALGCDNMSAGDTQNIFQSMKLYALLAAASDPELDRLMATEAGARGNVGRGCHSDLGRSDWRDPARDEGRSSDPRPERSGVPPVQ